MQVLSYCTNLTNFKINQCCSISFALEVTID